MQRNPPVNRLALQLQIAPGQWQCAHRIVVQPQGGQRQFAPVQRRVVTAPLQLVHARLQQLALCRPARIAQTLPGGRAPQHDGIGFRQRHEQLQRLLVFAGAQQQIAEGNGGVQIVLGRQAAGVGVSGRRITPGALQAFGQQRQQPATLTGIKGLFEQRLKALLRHRVLALQRLGFKAAGLGIQRLAGTRHRIAGGQRLGIAGRQAFERRQIQPALRMAGRACQRRRKHLSRRIKFMPPLLHRGLQNRQVSGGVKLVPPRGQRCLRTAPIAGVARLPGHGDVFAGLLCRRSRIAGWRTGGRGCSGLRRAIARHGGQDFQHFIVPYGLHGSRRCGAELHRQQQPCQRDQSGKKLHVECFHWSGHDPENLQKNGPAVDETQLPGHRRPVGGYRRGVGSEVSSTASVSELISIGSVFSPLLAIRFSM